MVWNKPLFFKKNHQIFYRNHRQDIVEVTSALNIRLVSLGQLDQPFSTQ